METDKNETDWEKQARAIAVTFAASMDLNFRGTVQRLLKAYPLAPDQHAADMVVTLMIDALVSGTVHVIASHANAELTTEGVLIKQIQQKFKDMRSAMVRQQLMKGVPQ